MGGEHDIRIGETVELVNGDFLTVKELIRDRSGEVHMRGILLRRVKSVKNMLPKKWKQLCAIIEARADGTDPNITEILTSKPLSSGIAIRHVVFTNQQFPAYSFRETGKTHKSWADVEDMGVLVCRWKYIEYSDTILRGVPSQALVRLREDECDAGKGVSDVSLMLTWQKDVSGSESGRQIVPRVDTSATTTKQKGSSDTNVVDLTEDDSDIKITTSFQTTFKRTNRFGVYEISSNEVVTERFTPASNSAPAREFGSRNHIAPNSGVHTFGDICAGAGGATRAAHQAGLHVNFVLDHEGDACRTQRQNFPHAEILEQCIFSFCDANFRQRPYMRVSVLHISFPCQTYSTAHTVPGKNDVANEATGYSAIPILEKCRPRVVTVEQTSNIVNGHKESFEALVHQFTHVGYNVRWKIVDFSDTGNVHARLRLLMIASCPGEPLPPFPKATHGASPALRRPPTIRKVLTQVPRNIDRHMLQFTPKDKQPYDDRCPLKGCITTGGGDADLHPSGKRSFNLQELAQLAGFPSSHKFVGNMTSIRKQIGNAVPAKAATPFFKEIVASLKKFDEEVAAWQSREQEIIDIDEEKEIIDIDEEKEIIVIDKGKEIIVID